MPGCGSDLKYAWRGMRRNPGVTAVAVMALGLGIGANSAVFTVLNGVLFRPLPFADSGRLVLLSKVPANLGMKVLGLWQGDYLELRKRGPAFDGITTYSPLQMTLTGAGEATRVPAATVTPEFFSVLRVAPARGRTF